MLPKTFKAFRVFENEDQTFSRKIVERKIEDLPAGEVLIRVHYAALNYKDALSATGNKGVTKNYPHTPGVDAAGLVVSSTDPRFRESEPVIVTSYDLGMNTDGGFAEYIRVPADWVVSMPAAIDLRESMIVGTAGFTAGLGLYKMEQLGQKPADGPILITGASGGVGSMAVAILAQAGYEVIASTGKLEAHEYLRRLGATICVGREEANDESKRPLMRPKWSGAIDTVGGNTLATALKACKPNGSVAACGLVASPSLKTTVFPFIINGVNLLGIDSATCPMSLREEVWEKLADEWRVPDIEAIATVVQLDDLDPYIDQILEGKTRGRILIDMA